MIEKIEFFPVFNSRGEKTVKVCIKTEKGVFCSIAPSGASKSFLEPVYLPVKRVLKIANSLKRKLEGCDEGKVDTLLLRLGGKRFEKIGGNLAIAISQAVFKALISEQILEKRVFPLPLSNVLGGGAHGGFTSIQEFLVFQKKAKSIEEAVETNVEIWKEVKRKIEKIHGYLGKNDEGAIVARLSDYEALEIVSEITQRFGAYAGLDIAASQFYKNGYYFFNGKKFKKNEFIDVVFDLVKTYKIKYVEDPFHEKDFSSFSELSKKLRKKALICGDDLFSTSPQRIKIGVKKNACNAVIIKPNQVGVVGRALKSVKVAKENCFVPIASHRSGESEDSFIAEFALFSECPLLKCSVFGSERFAKWNKLIELWKKIEKPKMANINFI